VSDSNLVYALNSSIPNQGKPGALAYHPYDVDVSELRPKPLWTTGLPTHARIKAVLVSADGRYFPPSDYAMWSKNRSEGEVIFPLVS